MEYIIKLYLYYIKKHLNREKFADNFLKGKLTIEETNKEIASMIQNGKPFMITRFGGIECSMLRAYKMNTVIPSKKNLDRKMADLCQNAGFFPHDINLIGKWYDLNIWSIAEIDMLGMWNLPMEDYFLSKYGNGMVKKTVLRNLEPYYCDSTPWTSELKGKRVLVIHPFSESIEYQYSRRKKIWGSRVGDILPEFELKTIKAVQTIAMQDDDRFEDWFGALDYMTEEARKIDFDIAIIGCGAYGMPLAARIKQMGKCAIHLGGATQILFGIKGNRWDAHPVISKLYNEHWIKPLEEKPKGFETIEGACYW